MFPRKTEKTVREALARQAAVALLGPRQVGKTTLAQRIGASLGALYLDLEDPEARARLSDPAHFLEAHEQQLVILDEIHRVPALFPTLRGVIDRGRGKGFALAASCGWDPRRWT
ncbi:MAG: AAA family ATPase [Rhodoferax sp.]